MESFSDTCNVLSSVTVQDYPYPFGYSPFGLPADLYNDLSMCRPAPEQIAGHRYYENNKRVDLRAVDALRSDFVDELWKSFIRYHTSHDFYRVILSKFGRYFHEYYPQYDFENFTTAVRYSGDKADIYLDCQIGINTPVKEKSSVSIPHLDHPSELWAGLLYMKEPDDNAGGDLLVYKCRDLPREFGKRQIFEDSLIEIQKIPYQPNMFACFMNSPFSIHAVTEREVTTKPRLLVNFSVEFMGKQFFDLSRMQ